MQCQQLTEKKTKHGPEPGRCTSTATWKVRIKAVVKFELYVCTAHFDVFRKAIEGKTDQWSATPITEGEHLCTTLESSLQQCSQSPESAASPLASLP